MKKLTIVVLILATLFTIYTAYSQQVVPTNQATVAWNKSISDPTLPGTYSYQIYIIPASADKNDTSKWQYITETTGFNATISFTVEGKYVVGVRTKRILQDGTELFSDINWSDDNGESTPNPFVIFFAVNPDMPLNLRWE